MGSLTRQPLVEGAVEKSGTRVFKKEVNFVDGSPADGISDESLGDFGGVLNDVRVLFGSPAPNTLTVTIKDSDGNQLLSESISASGSLEIEKPIAFAGGLTLSLSGNTTASATADLFFLFF